MMWPLSFTAPGQDSPLLPKEAKSKSLHVECEVVTKPNQVVTVAEFTDASMEPVVRRVDRELRLLLQRDRLDASSESEDRVQFAQYDAIFSLGKRRGEV
jgi:hypothetical protein